MEKHLPPWLKAMQNGSIGEARTKAFLLDRFWVLERSVDIDGADFIIQRRITNKNLLDRDAPRLGLIQVKFFGTTNTTHYVHRQYVENEKGEPRPEFFLICHAGDEENPSAYLLTAEEIVSNFAISGEPENEKYRLPYEKVVGEVRFQIANNKRALDRIERQLEHADFTQNRKFLSWALPSAALNTDAIDPLYREPIDNWWGDISTSFKDLKETARKAMIDIEGIYNLLSQVTIETDPLIAEELIADIAYECRTGMGEWRISLSDDLDSPDFFTVCRQHQKMVEMLKSDGLLDAFIDIKYILKKQVIGYVVPHIPISPNVVHRFILRYEPETLIVQGIESSLISADVFFQVPNVLNKFGHVEIDTRDYSKIDESRPGYIDYHWLPGRYGFSEKKKQNLKEAYWECDFSFYRHCLDAIYETRYNKTSPT